MPEPNVQAASALTESVGTWTWHVASGRLEIAPNMAQLINQSGACESGQLQDFLGCVLPQDRDRVEAELRRAARLPGEFSIEFQVVWPDGIVRGFEMRGISDGQPRRAERVTGVLWDASVALRIRTELRRKAEQSEQHLSAFRAARVSAWTLHVLTGRFEVDGIGEDLLGLVPGSFESTLDALLSVVYPEDRAPLRANLSDAMAGSDRFIIEFRVQQPDGSPRWLRQIGQVFRNSIGATVRATGILQDITAEMVAKLALENYAKELDVARSLAEEATRAKAQFLANMSHKVLSERN